jgi:hypothetical protein
MLSREELEHRFDPRGERIDRAAARCPRGGARQSDRHGASYALLKAFYNAAGHRLQVADARRAATAAGLSARALAASTPAHMERCERKAPGVLTPSGKQWYEENLASLMSESE